MLLPTPKMRSTVTSLMTTPMLSAPRKKAPKQRLIMCSRYLLEVSTLFGVACRPMMNRRLSVLVSRSLTYSSSGKWKRTSSTKQSSRVRKLTHTQHRATRFATQHYTTQHNATKHTTPRKAAQRNAIQDKERERERERFCP